MIIIYNTKPECNILLFQFVMKSNFLVCQNYVRDEPQSLLLPCLYSF